MLTAMALVSFSCSNDNTTKQTSNPSDATVTGTCVLSENPSWGLSDGLGYTSMSVTIDEKGVPASLGEGDKVAAFVGSSCRGVAVPFKTALGKMHVNLLIHSSSAASEETEQVEIRYYSAAEGGIYTAQPINYVDEAILGTSSQGYKLTWK